MKKRKEICYTLDLEADYEGMIEKDYYTVIQNKENINLFCNLIEKYNIKLTTFVTGEIFEKKEKAVEALKNLNSEFGVHTFSHKMDYGFNLKNLSQLRKEVRKGKEAFKNYFGYAPKAYRAATGVVSKDYLKIIAKEGFKIDSSVFPSWRPGYFNNLKEKTEPHFIKGINLLEIPFGVVPKIRLVIAESYIKLLGLPFYKMILNIFGFPKLIVFDFHLADLFLNPTRKKLPLYLRLAHKRNLKHGLKYFEKVIQYFQKKNYKSEYLSKIYEDYCHYPR